MASFGLTVIRTLFGMVDPVAPRALSSVAFELFCRTPNPKRIGVAERKALDKAAPLMLDARNHAIHSRGRKVAVHEFRPLSGGWSRTVLVVHGWGSRTEHMRALVDGFRDAGCRVIALDLPGHGKSAGRRLNIANAVAAVSTAEQWFGPFAAIVGHSFGGAVAVNAAVGSVAGIAPVATDRLVLIAAPSSMPMMFADFGRFLNLGPRVQTAVADRVQAIAGQPLDAYTGERQLAEKPIDTLVIHAADDKEVGAVHAEGYARAGAHVRLAWVNGLGHRRILGDPSVVVQAVDFVVGDSVAQPAFRPLRPRQRI